MEAAIKNVAFQINQKVPGRLHDKDWNPDYSIDIPITIKDAQVIDTAARTDATKGPQ